MLLIKVAVAIVTMAMTINGAVTEKTEIINPHNGTKTVITKTIDGEYESEFAYNSLTNEWEEK